MGRRQSWAKDISLADLVARVRATAAKKTGRAPEDFSLDELFLYDYQFRMAVSKGIENPKYEAQLKRYKEVSVPKYKKALKRYHERMKVYLINKEVYDAWLLKRQEDELLEQIKSLEASLRSVEIKRQDLLKDKVDEG